MTKFWNNNNSNKKKNRFGPPRDEANFNRALKILWEVAREINDALQLRDKRKEIMPHAVNDEKINGLPITCKGNWDNWTTTYKCLLTNLKFLIWRFSSWEKSMEDVNAFM